MVRFPLRVPTLLCSLYFLRCPKQKIYVIVGAILGYECAYYLWPGLFRALLLNTTLMSQISHHRHFEHESNDLIAIREV